MFWAKNRGCGLYTRPLLSEGVNWLVGVTNFEQQLTEIDPECFENIFGESDSEDFHGF